MKWARLHESSSIYNYLNLFHFDILRKAVLFWWLDIALKKNFKKIFSYVKLTFSWLSGFLEEAIHCIVNSCPGIINLPHMSEYFILRTYSVP